MIRKSLTDERWGRIEHESPGKPGNPGRNGKDNRLFVEAVLWIARTGSPWRDLPCEFGNWFTVYTRFWRWAKKGIWERVLLALSDAPDFEYVMIDGTICRVHQPGAGAKGGLKIRPSAARAADRRRKSGLWSTPWAISCASRCFPATAMMSILSKSS